jgi:LmbE family N-acetylglucosaminyl deacetylase
VLGLSLQIPDGRPLSLLCLGCHSDDIEIGCGGAVLTLRRRYPGLTIHWVVFSAKDVRKAEAMRAAELFIGSTASQTVELHDFRDGFFPYVGAEIKDRFEALKHELSPDLIFTHYGRDAHQDHRLVSELTWNTFRDHLILEYEIPKYDGDLGRPNLFVPLEQDVLMECNAPSGYAEAFYARKVAL